MKYDPQMELSIQVTHLITEELQPMQQLFDELKRKQVAITVVFQKVSR